MASSTSPTKKIPQKRVRVAFAKKEEWFSRKCLQLVGSQASKDVPVTQTRGNEKQWAILPRGD